MDSINTEPQQSEALPPEVRHIPLWVKGLVLAGIIIFAIQLPDFKSSLTDAIIKNRASTAEAEGRPQEAVKLYGDLRTRYPEDRSLIKKLAIAQYHAGELIPAIRTFDLLVGVKMPKTEVEEINAIISDIELKLLPRK